MRRSCSALMLGLACLVEPAAGDPPPAVSAEKAWDQREARADGFRVAEAVHALSEATREDVPGWAPGAYPAFRNTVDLLSHQAKSLRVQLLAGRGRADTEPLVVQLRALLGSAQRDAEADRVPPLVAARVADVDRSLATLAAYYGAPPPGPED